MDSAAGSAPNASPGKQHGGSTWVPATRMGPWIELLAPGLGPALLLQVSEE